MGFGAPGFTLIHPKPKTLNPKPLNPKPINAKVAAKVHKEPLSADSGCLRSSCLDQPWIAERAFRLWGLMGSGLRP